MGNTHSVETLQNPSGHAGSPSKKSPQKLSKPRVGNHASTTASQAAGLLGSHGRIASASLPPSRAGSFLAAPTHSREPSSASNVLQANEASPSPIPPPPPEPESKPATPAKDWRRRASLFRSKSSYESRRKDKRRATVVLSPEVGDRMSRANSMTWESQQAMDHARKLQVESWHVPGNRQSINYNLLSYESRRLLNLSEDPAAREDNSVMFESKFEVSRNTWKSSHPHQPASAQITRANSEVSLHDPVRRHSVVQTQTQTQITRANSEVSLYAPVRRRSMIQTPGLATRMPTEYSADRRSSFRHSLPPTPAGGRSRMNSIESSLSHIPPVFEFVAEPEFLPELLPEPVQEPVERALTPSDMEYRPLGTMKFGSLRITNGAASPIPSPDFEPPANVQAMVKPQTESDKNVEVTVSTVQLNTASKVLSPIKTSSLATELQVQQSNSPLSPELKIASKHTAVEDDLFDDDDVAEDDVQMEYSAEVLSVRNDPNAKPSLEQMQADQSQKNSWGVARADSGIVTSPTTEYQPKPLSKADSGYSSNVSLRSFHAKQAVAGKDQPPRAAAEESGDEKSESSSPAAGDVSIAKPALGHINGDEVAADASGSASSTPPPLPPKDDYLAAPASHAMTVSSPTHFFSLSGTHSFRRDRKTLASIDSSKASENGPTSPESVHSSGGGSDKSNSALSIGSGLHRPGKLQRLLSGSGMRGPPTVHATHPADEVVPSVPQDIQEKLIEHSGRFPISTKRLALRTQASKDTLKTIFSVGSFDAGQSEDQRDPSPEADRRLVARKPVAQASQAVERPKPPRRRSFQSVPASIAQAAASVMPRRSIHRKPVSTPVQKTDSDGELRNDEIQDGESAGRSPTFLALPPTNDDMPVPASRTFTMTAQMERNMGMHIRAQGQTTSMSNNPEFFSPPQSPQYLKVPLSLAAKRKTSPPVSLHTRTGKTVRKPAPRPQSASSSEVPTRRQTLSRQNSRENVHSYPSASPSPTMLIDEALTAPPIPPMSPRRAATMMEQQYAMRRQAAEEKWRPTNRRGSESGQATHTATRSMSMASSGLHYRQPKLRHRASYDGFAQQYGGPVARGPGYGLQAPVQGGGYYQQQLLNVQEQHWGQQQWEQQQWEQQQSNQQDYYSPDTVQPGLFRSRSRSRSVHAHPNPPYRVLHSYNSPAYRNVPIWG